MIRCNKTGHPMCRPPHQEPPSIHSGYDPHFFMIILYNHAMHIDTSIHDMPKALLVLKSSRPPHNSKLVLQNPKCSLYIFSSRRLCIVKLGLFLTSWLNNRLHKCLPPWVDAVGEKVAIVILVVICFKLHQWTFTQCKSCY
jgi:hypothetical protein